MKILDAIAKLAISIIILSLIFFFFGRWVEQSSRNEAFELYKKGNITVGRVYSYSSVAYQTIELECIIEGKKRILRQNSGRKVRLGEYFNVVYDKKQPYVGDVLYGQPIIPDSSLFAITTTETIDEWEDCGFSDCLEFSYTINGQKIEKEFYSDWFFPDRYKKINTNKKYKVIYNTQDPMIAYPILEDSIKVVYPISTIK